MKNEKEEVLESLNRFPSFSYLASDFEVTEKRLDRPAYLLLEYCQSRNWMAISKYEYSKEDVLFLSNLAIDTNDKDWFTELTDKLHMR